MNNISFKRFRYYGSKEGYCNICNKFTELTEDHVPPKGCIGINKKDVQVLTKYLACEEIKPRLFQSGLKFRTICSNCNKILLGQEYDPELIQLSREIGLYLRVKNEFDFSLPKYIKVKTVILPKNWTID
jgi:hypothetical protein